MFMILLGIASAAFIYFFIIRRARITSSSSLPFQGPRHQNKFPWQQEQKSEKYDYKALRDEGYDEEYIKALKSLESGDDNNGGIR